MEAKAMLSTGSEAYNQLLKFTEQAKALGVISFVLNSDGVGAVSLTAHMLPKPQEEETLTTDQLKKRDERDIYGAG